MLVTAVRPTLGVAGEFGKELDSLSDVVSFGAASAFLIYTYSLQTLGWVGAIPAIIYAALGGIRLARFNLNTGVVHGYFQGMPIPNGAASSQPSSFPVPCFRPGWLRF